MLRIKELRIRDGLTQEEFGKKIDVTNAAISKWELQEREPCIPKLIQIADFFNVTLDELVGRSFEEKAELREFSQVLKELRVKNNFTQNKLSINLCVTQQAVGKWEANVCEPSIKNLIKLAKLFDVTVGYLLGVEDAQGKE